MNQAKDAVSGLVLKYVARASVAIPFVIALGFAIAAVSVMLVQRFGHVAAYWMMAGGLAATGVVAAIAVSVKEHDEEAAEEKAEATDTQEVVSDATAQAMVQAPLALLGALFTAPGGASSAIKVAGILVLLLVLIGAFFWPTESEQQVPETDSAALKPNGRHPRRYLSLALAPRQPILTGRQFRQARRQGLPARLRTLVTYLPKRANREGQSGRHRQCGVGPITNRGADVTGKAHGAIRHVLSSFRDLIHNAFGACTGVVVSAIVALAGLSHGDLLGQSITFADERCPGCALSRDRRQNV
jgi:hypothetical protein